MRTKSHFILLIHHFQNSDLFLTSKLKFESVRKAFFKWGFFSNFHSNKLQKSIFLWITVKYILINLYIRYNERDIWMFLNGSRSPSNLGGITNCKNIEALSFQAFQLQRKVNYWPSDWSGGYVTSSANTLRKEWLTKHLRLKFQGKKFV